MEYTFYFIQKFNLPFCLASLSICIYSRISAKRRFTDYPTISYIQITFFSYIYLYISFLIGNEHFGTKLAECQSAIWHYKDTDF